VEEGEAVADIRGLFVKWVSRRENRKLQKGLAVDDSSREYVEVEGCAAFGSSPVSNRLAVERKLTLMSEMSKRLVADKRLRQWIEDALEEDGDSSK